MAKTKKNMCTMRRAALSLTITAALLCGGAFTPAYAAAGFTSLKDIQTEAEAGSADRAIPVIGPSFSIVFDPKSLVQDLKNFAVQLAIQKIQGLLNNNIVGGFIKQIAKQEDVKKTLAELQASVGLNQISADDRRQDAKNFVDRELVVGAEAARIRADALATADALCEAVGVTTTLGSAAIAGKAPPKGRGSNPRVAEIFKNLETRTSNSGDIATAFKNVLDEGELESAYNNPGAPSDRGAVQEAINRAQKVPNYANNKSFYGGGENLKLPAENPRVAMDVDGSVLLPDGETLYCTQQDINGTDSLMGYNDSAFCSKQPWKGGGPDLGTVLAFIKERIVPPPFAPLSSELVKRAMNGNGPAAEILERWKSYMTRQVAVSGALHLALKDKIAVAFSTKEAAKEFAEKYKHTYGPKAVVPVDPSDGTRMKTLVDYYNSDYYITEISAAQKLADRPALEILNLRIQANILENLKTTNALLTIQAGKQLFGERDELQQRIKQAGS